MESATHCVSDFRSGIFEAARVEADTGLNLTDDASEAQIVVLPHQLAPSLPFVDGYWAHHKTVQREVGKCLSGGVA